MAKLDLSLRTTALLAASALALAACGRAQQTAPPLAALPLTDGPSQPGSLAPPVAALPSAAPARVARLRDPAERYAYADRARAYGEAFGDAPPDYSFDYGGVRPWAWMTDDHALRVAEPLPGGGERWFYYQPGADEPFLVRGPDGAYGFSDGELAVVYGPDGAVLPPDAWGPRRDDAGRLLLRAAALYAASQHNERVAVARADWSARRAELDADRSRWAAGAAQDAEWRAYHDAHAAEEQAHFADERARRQADAARAQGFLAGLGFAGRRDDVQRQDDAARLADDRARAAAANRPVGGPPAYGPVAPSAPAPTPAGVGARPQQAFPPVPAFNRPAANPPPPAFAGTPSGGPRGAAFGRGADRRMDVRDRPPPSAPLPAPTPPDRDAQRNQHAQAEQARQAQAAQQHAQAEQARQAQAAQQHAQAEQARQAQAGQQHAQAEQARQAQAAQQHAQAEQARQAQAAQARQAQAAQPHAHGPAGPPRGEEHPGDHGPGR